MPGGLAMAVALCIVVTAAGRPTAEAQRGPAPRVPASPNGGATSAAAPPALASSSTDEDRDARARRLFELGRTAYENARYEDAMRYFEESYALSGRAALLFNIGQAADRLRRDDRAIEAFEAYLAASPSAPNRVEVETRLEVLRRARAERNATDAAEAGATSGDVGSRESTEARGSNAEEAGAGVLGKWWFWAVVGAVVAGAAVGVAVAASAGGADPLPPGDFGGVILTLGEGR